MMSDDAPKPPPRDRRMTIVALIVLAAAVFFIAESSLYYRWSSAAEPKCMLLVAAGPSLRGAEVEVDGIKLIEPLTATIGEKNQFTMPFYLDAGEYAVRVTLNNQVQYQNSFTLSKFKPGLQLDLTRFEPAATAPASSPAASQPGYPTTQPAL